MQGKLRAGLAAVVVGLIVVSVAAATSAVPVTGTYAVTDLGTTTCAPVGSSVFLIRCETTGFVSQYGGDLSGSTITEFSQVINCKTGRTQGKGVETFTGTVNGVGVGTLTWHDHFHATMDCATYVVSDFVGKGVHVSGTGDLAGLEGKIRFTLSTYDGTLH
jgi:hypothetical protein